MQIKARQVGIPRDAFTYIQCDLASFESVHKFVEDFRATGRQVDAVVCNAAVYLPVDPEPSFSVEGYELSVAVNHLGHFLLANLLLPDLEKSDWKRCGLYCSRIRESAPLRFARLFLLVTWVECVPVRAVLRCLAPFVGALRRGVMNGRAVS